MNLASLQARPLAFLPNMSVITKFVSLNHSSWTLNMNLASLQARPLAFLPNIVSSSNNTSLLPLRSCARWVKKSESWH